MEVPGLGVGSELQLPAYATATATAMLDPSHNGNPCGSLQWCYILILNPLSKARDRSHIFMDPVGFLTHWANLKYGIPEVHTLKSILFIQTSLVFTSCVFSVLVFHLWYQVTFSCHVSLGPSWAVTISQTPCFWWPWQFWGCWSLSL